MMERVDVKILGGGGNWIGIGGKIALGLVGYYSPLPKGSTASVVTCDPGMACLDGTYWVDEGRYDMGITTPDWFVKLAIEGKPPFKRKLNLRMLAIFPHDDRMLFAVKRETQLRTFGDVKDRKYPLQLSTIPRTTWHPALWGAEVVMGEYGMTLDDIESWGGKLLGDRPRFINKEGSKMVTDGFDAVFDEAIMTRRWKVLTDENDLKFLPIDPAVAKKLEAQGWKMGKLEKGRFKGVDEDIPVADFSNWALYCREGLDDELAYLTIKAIDEQKHDIEKLFPAPHAPLTAPVDMSKLGRNSPVPLHPGAERYYKEKGYL